MRTKRLERRLLSALVPFAALMFAFSATAQMTVGTSEEALSGALLQLKSEKVSEDEVNATKGLAFPRVNLSQKDKLYPMFLQANGTVPTADYTSTADVNMKNKEHTGLVVYNMYESPSSVTNPNLTFKKGLYVWTGMEWKDVVAGELASEPWRISGTTNQAESNAENIYQMGSVTIGSTAAADPTAALNVEATNKGVLLPRVVLEDAKDDWTIPNPTVGLLVYNKGEFKDFPVEGYMFWNGEEWLLIGTYTSSAPNASFECGMARLDPEQVLQAGVPIVPGTVLRVPYTVGNGGMYNGVALKSTDPASDIEARISSGIFENGSGYLAFNLSGTPTANQVTPTGVTFDLTPFYDANPTIPLTGACMEITVGTEIKADIVTTATMDNMKLTTDNGVKGYATMVTTPDGRFSIRAFVVDDDWDSHAGNFSTDDLYGMQIQIRNNTDEDIVIAGTFDYHWQGSAGTTSNKLLLQPGKWSGDGSGSNSSNSIYYAPYLDGNTPAGTLCGVANTTDKNHRCRFLAWGNAGVYATGAPERRDYSWTVNDGAVTKVAYLMQFSSSATDPDITADSESCPNGICTGTKVYMKVDQITAP